MGLLNKCMAYNMNKRIYVKCFLVRSKNSVFSFFIIVSFLIFVVKYDNSIKNKSIGFNLTSEQ